jgi:hypothetical protein
MRSRYSRALPPSRTALASRHAFKDLWAWAAAVGRGSSGGGGGCDGQVLAGSASGGGRSSGRWTSNRAVGFVMNDGGGRMDGRCRLANGRTADYCYCLNK